ncbi:hypothetical protein M378DRAFT_941926 [Amanita muscaria Koide BX008]|uniref:Uncharacterized protein n=1 Tax=Amanita muscaria (strain Koide BX008) TaxID=946122 RepID=A0A0C2SXL2_AMAMK|nr:hypothetical protein M378DRAFT_941926 [Amanita muscaria Koide BX008]
MRVNINVFFSAEERQDQNAKRRKLDMQQRGDQTASNVSPSALLHPSLPPRPTSFAANADSIGLGAAPTTESVQHTPTAVQALAGSNRDVVANRRSIRMANMSAAEVLKAELASPSATSAKLDLSLPMKPISSAISSTAAAPSASLDAARMSAPVAKVLTPDVAYESLEESTEDFPGLGTADLAMSDATEERKLDIPSQDDPGVDTELHGVKRKFEEGPGEPADEGDEEVATIEDEDEEGAPVPSKRHALKVNPDGTVEQEDTVRLWEPGYKECIPGSTYYSPLPQPEFTDIKNDRSLSVLYYFPRQLRPHRSELLPGARKPPRQLSAADLETTTRQGGRGRGRGPPDATNGGGRNSWTSGGHAERRNDPFHTKPNNYGSQTSRGRGAGYGGRGGNTQSGSYTQRPPYAQSTPNSYQQYGPGGGYGAPGGRPPPSHYGTYGGRGAAPPRGPSNSAMSGGGGYNNNNAGGYGTYGDGGYNSGAPGGYGSYGSHSTPSHPARGAPFNTSRGRGRGW